MKPQLQIPPGATDLSEDKRGIWWRCADNFEVLLSRDTDCMPHWHSLYHAGCLRVARLWEIEQHRAASVEAAEQVNAWMAQADHVLPERAQPVPDCAARRWNTQAKEPQR